jgi:hypothetical protein
VRNKKSGEQDLRFGLAGGKDSGTIQVAGLVHLFTLAAVGAARAGSFQPRVQIYDVVQVEGEVVKLSDLLPADAPEGLDETCRQVVLGDAPLVASQRVISRVQIEQRLREFPSTLKRLEIPERVIVTRKRRRLSSAEILSAIESFLAREDSSALRPPRLNGLDLQAPVFVTKPDPGLEVKRLELDRVERKTRFLLWTSKEPQVLPFYVTVEGLPETTAGASSHNEQTDKGPIPTDSHGACRQIVADLTDSPGFPGGSSPCGTPHRGGSTQPGTSSSIVLVAVGKPAKLVVETATLRLSALVTPLQSGVQGQIIRVRNQDTQRVLEAEVIGAGLLQAELGGE